MTDQKHGMLTLTLPNGRTASMVIAASEFEAPRDQWVVRVLGPSLESAIRAVQPK